MTEGMVLKGSKFFREGESFFINKCEERTKQNIIFHSHDFVEICYVSAGNGYHLVRNKEYQVHKGDLFIINYDISHTFYKMNSKDSLVAYNIMFKPDFLDQNLINLNDFNDLTLSYLFKDVWSDDFTTEDLRLSGQEQVEFDALFGGIYREYILKQQGYMNIIRSYLVTLIIKIMRSFSKRCTDNVVIDKRSMIINSAIKHLRENYSRSLNLEELALKTFYSKNYLCRLFKEITGTTLSDYLQNFRVQEACKLLNGNMKILDIAYEVGFSDYKAFFNSFKKIKGTSPSKYREKAWQYKDLEENTIHIV